MESIIMATAVIITSCGKEIEEKIVTVSKVQVHV
jgi:hypothetical protein